ncbi:hypothetical protein ACE3NQ_14080 [Paenibacillus terreus]|uniref:Uncharacterized protein n=1 Tax=Paenibacillus terreus TaxID=1387834 RepID=A0ABV5B8M6_9BACL
MIEKLVIPLLLVILLMYVLDRKKLKNSPAVNRWFAYILYAVSFAIWLYETRGTTTIHPSVLLARMIDSLIPLP